MTNNWITWVLLAPGLASGFCFITEDFVEGMQSLWELLEHCCCRKRDSQKRAGTSDVAGQQSE